jgi:two-component system NtrC family response regulator
MHLSEDAVRAIEAHPWPGNIRELRTASSAPPSWPTATRSRCDEIGLAPAPSEDADRLAGPAHIRDEAESSAIIAALGRVNGNIVKAAELLGVSRPRCTT